MVNLPTAMSTSWKKKANTVESQLETTHETETKSGLNSGMVSIPGWSQYLDGLTAAPNLLYGLRILIEQNWYERRAFYF